MQTICMRYCALCTLANATERSAYHTNFSSCCWNLAAFELSYTSIYDEFMQMRRGDERQPRAAVFPSIRGGGGSKQ